MLCFLKCYSVLCFVVFCECHCVFCFVGVFYKMLCFVKCCFLKFGCVFQFCCVFYNDTVFCPVLLCFEPPGHRRKETNVSNQCSSFLCDSQSNGVAFNTEPPPGTQTGRPGLQTLYFSFFNL